MTGPMRLAPAGMLLAATLALVALTLPLDLSVGAGAVPLGQTPTSLSPRAPVARVSEAPAEKLVVVRLRNSSLRLPGEPALSDEPSSLEGFVSPSWLRTHATGTRETLSEISRATGVSVAALSTTGHLSEDALARPGQALVQRATDAAGRTVPVPLRAHTVAQGESLWGISQEAGVSVATVVAANNLPDVHAALRPGQILMIPAPEVALVPDTARSSELTITSWNGLSPVSWSEFASSRTHTVAPGESLWAISEETGVSLGALMAANNLSEGAVLHSGQLLVIPAPDTIPAPRVPAPNTAGPNGHTSTLAGSHRGSEHGTGSVSAPRTYTVAYGDTLWDIARDAGVSLGEILAVNQISETDTIHPGDILILPRSTRDPALSSSRVSEQLSTLTSMDGVTMIWPTSGRITSGFGPRQHPIFRDWHNEFHTGIDIGTRLGHDVRAALGGIVRYVGWMGGYGKIIIVDHGNGLETAYAHLSVWVVSRGQRVEQGQKIGEVGRTGWSTGPHLLFEIRKSGRPVNPMDYLRP